MSQGLKAIVEHSGNATKSPTSGMFVTFKKDDLVSQCPVDGELTSWRACGQDPPSSRHRGSSDVALWGLCEDMLDYSPDEGGSHSTNY